MTQADRSGRPPRPRRSSRPGHASGRPAAGPQRLRDLRRREDLDPGPQRPTKPDPRPQRHPAPRPGSV